MDDAIPIELRDLTGIGKEKLRERRRLWRLGLIHSDDEPNRYGDSLDKQMVTLQRRAVFELRNNKGTRGDD